MPSSTTAPYLLAPPSAPLLPDLWCTGTYPDLVGYFRDIGFKLDFVFGNRLPWTLRWMECGQRPTLARFRNSRELRGWWKQVAETNLCIRRELEIIGRHYVEADAFERRELAQILFHDGQCTPPWKDEVQRISRSALDDPMGPWWHWVAALAQDGTLLIHTPMEYAIRSLLCDIDRDFPFAAWTARVTLSQPASRKSRRL